MNQPKHGGVWDRLDACLSAGDLHKAIAEVEEALGALPATEFHALQGKSILAQRDALLGWVDDFYARASHKHPVGALCLELNAFDANTDAWFLDGLAYDTENDCLVDEEPAATTAAPFVLRGLETGQEAFASYAATDQPAGGPLEPARDLAAALVELRAQELVAHAHRAAQSEGRAWGRVSVVAKAEDSDRIYESPGAGAQAAPHLAAPAPVAPVAVPTPRSGTAAPYHKLTLSSDPKVIGVRNGFMQVEICDEAFVAAVESAPVDGTEMLLSDHAKNLAITCIRVLPRAKLTDVLSFGPMLSWFPFFVKRKTLALLSTFHTQVAHVFPVALDPDPHGLNDYVLVMLQPLGFDCLDYARSTFYTGFPLLGNHQQHRFANAEAYFNAYQTVFAQPERVVLAPHVDKSLDLILLVVGGLYVSDRLKQALEQERTTGIKTSDTMLPTVE